MYRARASVGLWDGALGDEPQRGEGQIHGGAVVPAVDEPRVLVVDLVCGCSDREEVRVQHRRYIGSKLSAVDHGADDLLVWIKSEHSSPPRRVEVGGDRGLKVGGSVEAVVAFRAQVPDDATSSWEDVLLLDDESLARAHARVDLCRGCRAPDVYLRELRLHDDLIQRRDTTAIRLKRGRREAKCRR